MPRTLTAGQIAALTSSSLQPAIFVMATFATGPVYLWTGIGSIIWGGHTWLGVGNMGTISGVQDGTTVEARGIVMSLSGFDASLLGTVMTEFQLGAPAMIYLGLFSNGALIDTPITSWAGRMDQPTVDVQGDSATITINCESRLVEMNTPVYRRNTNDDQQIDHPGDRGFDFVDAISEVTIYWGRVPHSKNNV